MLNYYESIRLKKTKVKKVKIKKILSKFAKWLHFLEPLNILKIKKKLEYFSELNLKHRRSFSDKYECYSNECLSFFLLEIF